MNTFTSLYFCNHFKRWKVEVDINDKRTSMNFSRYLMCHKAGRWLDRDEYVHHVDGDKLNDLITNLSIIAPNAHTKLHNSGENNPAAKLNANQVRKIRRLYYKRGWTQSALAERFHCSDSAIYRIVNGLLWRGIR